MYEVYDYTAKEVVKEAEAHMKMRSKYQMSPVTLKMHSGTHSQMIQEKGYQWTK